VLYVPLFNNGLKTAPFLLVTAAAALYGDFGAGILAILLGAIAVEYLSPPTGFEFTTNTLFKCFEFLVLGGIIFLLSWRSRRLTTSNNALINMSEMLQDITVDLQAESRINEKQLQKINAVNKDLVMLVNDFIEDDAYWSRKLPTSISLYPKKRIAK
jgi:hypothetical protein